MSDEAAKPPASDWQSRVRQEMFELEQKMEKLDAFLQSETCGTLTKRMQDAMHNQLEIMTRYSAALQERLDAAAESTPVQPN